MPQRSLIKGYSLSTYLVLIVFIAVVPLILFSSFVVDKYIDAKREASEKLLLKTVDDQALAFDREVLASIRTLQALTKANALRNSDLKAFHGLLTRVLKTQPSWASILLHDVNLKWILNAQTEYNAPLGALPEPESIREAIRTKRPYIGKVISIPVTHKINAPFGFNVRVPVLSDNGEVLYVLSAIITSDSIQALLSETESPKEWIKVIVDQTGTIVARSHNAEKLVGGPASETLRKLMAVRTSGLEPTFTIEGVRSQTGFKRAQYSGWFAATAVSQELLEAPARRALMTLFLTAALLLVISSLITLLLSRWLKFAIKRASGGAAELAQGKLPVIPPSGIYEVNELRNSLLRASDLLRSRERAKSDFLANMSHELRTPLGIVLGTADLLSDNRIETGDRSRAWETIRRNGEQLRRLIDDILDFSKLEADKLVVENLDFSITELVGSIVDDFIPIADSKGIKLRFLAEPSSNDLVTSDPVRVRQIISNLISNAVKFTDRGSVEVKLDSSQHEVVSVLVTDTGIGLTEQQQNSLFLDFTQGDSSHTRKYGGTGLGLSLSRKLARLLSGEVRVVQSTPGVGSTFEVTFKNHAASGKPLSEKSLIKLNHKIDLSKRRILLAEDSADNVALMKAYLKESGVQISVASNGSQAIDLAKANKFDLILMDIQMPQVDGYEATKMIREFDQNTPILALTAHALREERERAMQAGFNDYLTKPIKRDTLLQVLERII